MDADVAVVGCGPVGQTLAVLLAGRGWRVVVLERWATAYALPRATTIDGDTARLLASAGVGEALTGVGIPVDAYEFRNGAGEVLLGIENAPVGPYGWAEATAIHQPDLESVLSERAAKFANLRVERGFDVVDVVDLADRVEVRARDRTITARWVVGCDGANSVVRERMGVATTDLGYSFDWLLCDVTLHDDRVFSPMNVQICDPARPTTLVASGPARRRWEFMRLPHERAGDLNRIERAWELLAPFGVRPGNATLHRHAVYSFQARWAESWRRGRLLLAGDAAHLMPPFAGQGMCSGVRDAANLAWKLDLVLRGECAATVLDTYTAERLPNVRELIASSVRLGKVICVSDPKAAADRDVAMIAAARSPRATTPRLPKAIGDGVLYRDDSGKPAARAGELMPQGRVSCGGVTGWFDDVAGTGFVLVSSAPVPDLGVRAVRVVPEGHGGGSDAVVDVDGVYLGFLGDAEAVLVRPDFHVFGVGTPEALVKSLNRQLA